MCTHYHVVQIIIDSVELHSITIHKHEMDLKLYALTCNVGKCITKAFLIMFLPIKWQFDYKSKKNAQDIYNKKNSLLEKRIDHKDD